MNPTPETPLLARSATQPPQRRVIVDTDGGVDDAAALWFLLGEPTIDVVAITIVWGNVDTGVAASSVCRVLEAAGRPDIPVAIGRDTPFAAAPELTPATFIHGDDGLGNTNRPPASFGPITTSAVQLLREMAMAEAGELSLLTLGPLSNIAELVTTHPEIAGCFADIVIMGGVANGPGNALPLGEANIAHDPAAAAAVLSAGWCRPGVLVGLDVTHKATFTKTEVDLLAKHRSAAAAFLDEPLAFYRRFGGVFCPDGESPCHDLLAAMVMADISLVDAPLLPVAIDTSGGAAWGTTVVDLRRPFFARGGDASAQDAMPGSVPWRVALDVDVPRFRSLLRTLLGGDSEDGVRPDDVQGSATTPQETP